MEEIGRVLHDTAGRLFQQHFPLRARTRDDASRAIDSWQAIEEVGLPLALVQIDHGGFGMATADALELLVIAGRYAVPLPLAEAMLANRLLAMSGLKLLGSITTISDSAELALVRENGGWRLTGRARSVAFGRAAAVVLIASMADGWALVCVPAGAAEPTPGANLAGEPRDNLAFDLRLSDEYVRSAPPGYTPERVRATMASLRAQTLAGAIAGAVEESTTFAGERIQFGKPIGKFQVIQHQLAIMAGHAAASATAARIGIDVIEQGDVSAAAVAKARTSEAAGLVASAAHQIHGAIGFTYEHHLRLLTTRLWAWRDEFGNEAYWYHRIGSEALRSDLWQFLLAEPSP